MKQRAKIQDITDTVASRVAVYIYCEPVVAVLFGVTLLAEPLSWQIIAGGVLIAGSVAVVNLVKKKGERKHRIFS